MAEIVATDEEKEEMGKFGFNPDKPEDIIEFRRVSKISVKECTGEIEMLETLFQNES